MARTAKQSDNSSVFLLLLGLLLLGGAGVGVYYTVRGLRNNNPGNIKFSTSNTWTGQTGQDADGFVIFATMIDGIRALAKILINYGAAGFDTVSTIIPRYSTTDQAAYEAAVDSALGVSSDTVLDMTDPDTITNLVNAITAQENGFNPLSASTITAGVSAAMNS